MELMSKRDQEVLLLLDPVYELVMLHTEKLDEMELTSIESSKVRVVAPCRGVLYG